MFARALIVLLLVLNVGVASWWLLRPDAAPSPSPSPAAATAPSLQLLSGPSLPATPATLATVSAATANAPTATAATAGIASSLATADARLVIAGDERCFRFGPYPDADAAAKARAGLPPQVTRSAFIDTAGDGRGWRVWLPPLPDRDAAQAMAARIAAAGFDDYYVVPDGVEANSIALGRYGNAQAAQRRQAALRAAGFEAQAAALGGQAQWLLVAAPPAFDAEAARVAVGAGQQHAVACTALHSPSQPRPR
jgi:hypothetical protein